MKGSFDFLGKYRRYYFGEEDDIAFEIEPTLVHADFDWFYLTKVYE